MRRLWLSAYELQMSREGSYVRLRASQLTEQTNVNGNKSTLGRDNRIQNDIQQFLCIL